MIVFIFSVFIFITSNIYLLYHVYQSSLGIAVLSIIGLFTLLFTFVPTLVNKKKQRKRLQMCYNSCIQLTSFLISCIYSGIYNLYLILFGVPFHPELHVSPLFVLLHVIIVICIEALVFWVGIIRLYLSSTQIRIKWRVIGAVCGMIPVVHLFVLFHMLKLAFREVRFENAKIELNNQRKEQRICQTKYPIIMVHGVFFRDFQLVNYWGRIPEELERNGANIFYGSQESAQSVADCGRELSYKIDEVLKRTGAEKVNIIAHSKGGLDTRYAIDKYDMGEKIASLTTINTPHRGCEFADYLLGKIPEKQQMFIASTYNAALKKLGDKAPDFITAVSDLTASACKARNEEIKDCESVYIQSFGSILKKPVSGRFPLNLTVGFVKHFDGRNDGLVGEDSFAWGSRYTLLENTQRRGISHGDMIDLNRENIPGFDVREFYVQLVKELKDKGF